MTDSADTVNSTSALLQAKLRSLRARTVLRWGLLGATGCGLAVAAKAEDLAVALVLFGIALAALILAVVLWAGPGGLLCARKYARMIDRLPLGMYRATTDQPGRFLVVNNALAGMLGFEDRRELLATQVASIYLRPSDRLRLLNRLKARGEVRGVILQLVRKDQTPIWASVSARLVLDNRGKPVQYDGLIEDVTSARAARENREQAERRLRAAHHRLQLRALQLEAARLASLNMIKDMEQQEALLKEARRELAEMNSTLEDKVHVRTTEVQRLLNQKEMFVAQLGHDLKTPLTPLVALLPILRDESQSDEAREMLGILVENVDYMRKLVDRTLKLAKMNCDSFRMEFEPMDLATQVRDILASLGSSFAERSITVENRLEAPVVVPADRIRVIELFHNVLSNAIKFTEPGGTVRIEAQVDADDVWVAVTDTGIGMSPEQLGRIFDEFYKADEARHDRGASGLGLSICRRIVELHGGRIEAQSPGLGEGSTIRFNLPMRRPVAEEDPGSAQTSLVSASARSVDKENDGSTLAGRSAPVSKAPVLHWEVLHRT